MGTLTITNSNDLSNTFSNNISEKGAEFLGRSLFNLKNLRSLNLGLYKYIRMAP